MERPAARQGLEGVDLGDESGAGLRAKVRGALRGLRLLLTDPAGWSARRYRRENEMHLAALKPEEWK